MKKSKGFTLVELLVVISIIALLLAVLMPALQKARKLSQRAVDSSNMHQWGIAVAAYAADNRGFFPYNGVTKPNNNYLDYNPSQISDPRVWTPGYDLAWNSRMVQEFWAKYLVKADKNVKSKKNNVLFCPTQLAHRTVAAGDLAMAINQGLCGYFWLPGRDPELCSMNYGPAEDNRRGKLWVNKQRLGQYPRSPILVDVCQSMTAGYAGSGSSPWVGAAGAYSSHAGKDGQPDGQYYMFEDGHTVWIQWQKINVNDSAQQRKVLGASGSGWNCYYRIPLGVY